MLVEPGVEVNTVVHKSSPQPNWHNAKPREERAANAKIGGGLLARQASGWQEWQSSIIIVR